MLIFKTCNRNKFMKNIYIIYSHTFKSLFNIYVDYYRI